MDAHPAVRDLGQQEGRLSVDRPQSGAAPEISPRASLGRTGDSITSVIRWGWYSIVINVILVVLHGLIAVASGSLAVTAELIHNFVDLASAAVVVIGLKLAVRKTRAFPYGLYKVENLVAAGLAIMIFLTAYEVVSSVFLAPPGRRT